MTEKAHSEFKRTTVWLPIQLYSQAKIWAIVTQTSFSVLLRSALIDKIKKLKEEAANETNIPKST